MQFVGPQNFLELLGAALLFVGVVLSFLSLVPALRTSALRLSAISFLAALAIFSNYWVTYFAAIFIIATAVTELEFLHILAAIIRGDKNYFDFRREFLTHDEALKKSQRDAGIEGETSKIESSVKKQPAKALHISGRGRALATTAFRLEERALDWYEQKFGTPVQRYVRFIGQSRSAEVDGFVEGRPGTPDTIIEIKWFHNEHPGTGFHSRLIEQVADIYQRYELITKKKVQLVLLLLVPERKRVPQAILEQFERRLTERGLKYQVAVVDYNDLNVTEVGDGDNETNPAA